MIGEMWRGCKERDHVASDVERFDGAEAEAGDLRFIENLAQEIEKIVTGRKIAAPGAEIDATEDDFFVACVGEVVDFSENDFWRKAAAFPADERDDAEGAAVVAAV